MGLEWGAVLQMVPAGADRDLLIEYLQAWEQGMLEGVVEKAPRS